MKKKILIITFFLVLIIVLIIGILNTANKEKINEDILLEYSYTNYQTGPNSYGMILLDDGKIYEYKISTTKKDEEFFNARKDINKRADFVKSIAEYKTQISEKDLVDVKNLLKEISDETEKEERLIHDFPSSELLYYNNGEMITIKQSTETEFVLNKSEKTHEVLKKLNELGIINTSFMEEENIF